MKVKFFKVLQGKKKKERNKRRLQVIQFVFKSFSHSVHLVNNRTVIEESGTAIVMYF